MVFRVIFFGIALIAAAEGYHGPNSVELSRNAARRWIPIAPPLPDEPSPIYYPIPSFPHDYSHLKKLKKNGRIGYSEDGSLEEVETLRRLGFGIFKKLPKLVKTGKKIFNQKDNIVDKTKNFMKGQGDKIKPHLGGAKDDEQSGSKAFFNLGKQRPYKGSRQDTSEESHHESQAETIRQFFKTLKQAKKLARKLYMNKDRYVDKSNHFHKRTYQESSAEDSQSEEEPHRRVGPALGIAGSILLNPDNIKKGYDFGKGVYDNRDKYLEKVNAGTDYVKGEADKIKLIATDGSKIVDGFVRGEADKISLIARDGTKIVDGYVRGEADKIGLIARDGAKKVDQFVRGEANKISLIARDGANIIKGWFGRK